MPARSPRVTLLASEGGVVKKSVIQILVGMLLAFGIGLTLRVFSPALAQSLQSGPSFTALKVVKYYGESGAEEMRDTRVEVFRSDGSYAVSQKRDINAGEGRSADTVEMLQVLDRQSDVFFTAFPEVSMISSVPGKTAASPVRPGNPSCGDTTEAASVDPSPNPATILGYRVVKRTREISIDDSYVRVESWLAPELGCYALRESGTRADGRVKRSEEVISVTPGVADEAAFAMPKDFKEVPPSEAFRALEALRGRIPSSISGGVDELYHKQRASR
jgi:hypothetical protein